MNPLHETLAWLRAEIEKRIAAHNTIAELCGAELLPSILAPSSQPALQPVAEPKAAEPKREPATSGRVSKYIEPLVKCLASGPKPLGEIEAALNVAAGCFINQLQGRTDLFRKVGAGRGSKWELTEAGKKEMR